MADERKRRRWIPILVLLVLYPLSVGPAYWLAMIFDLPASLLDFVYTPLYWAAEATGTEDIFLRYIAKFIPLDL